MSVFRWLLLSLSQYSICVFATSATWNINASGNWNTNPNWIPATFPNAVDDTAQFLTIITTPRTVTLTQNITVGTMNFNGAQAYTIAQSGGFFLTMQKSIGNAEISVLGSTGAHSISSPISLTNTLNFSNSGSGNFTISGAISGVGGLNVSATGTGNLTLGSATNSYSGPTTISSGTLLLNTSGIISSSASCTVNGTLNITASNKTINELSGSGIVSLGTRTLTTNISGTPTFSGALQGTTGGLIKTGTGTLTLTGTNTYTGSTTISSGTLKLSTPGTINSSSNLLVTGTFDISGAASSIVVGNLSGISSGMILLGSNSLTTTQIGTSVFSGSIQGTGGYAKAGSGTLTLDGINTYSGGTTISAGTLKFIDLTGLGSSSAPITFSGTSPILQYVNPSSTNITISAPIILNGPATNVATFTAGQFSPSLSPIVTFTNSITGGGQFKTGSGAGSIFFNNPSGNSYSGGTTVNQRLIIRDGNQVGSGDITLIGRLDFIPPSVPTSLSLANNIIGNTGSFVSIGVPYQVTLTSSGNYSGTPSRITFRDILSGGPSAGTIILTGTNAVNAIYDLRESITIVIDTAANLGPSILLFNGPDTMLRVTNTTLAPVILPNTLQFHQSVVNIEIAPSKTLTLSGFLENTGGSGNALSISGGGTAYLTNTINSYKGGTIVGTNTTLQIDDNEVLGYTGIIPIVPGNTPITLFNNSVFEIKTTLTSPRPISLDIAPTIQVNTGVTATLTGGISDHGLVVGSLNKTGSGILILSTTNTYTGGTTISQGTIALSGSGVLYPSGDVITNGIFDISGASSAITIGNLTGAGIVNLGSQSLTSTTTGSQLFSGNIQGTGDFIKTGQGTLTIDSLPSFTGNSFVLQGTLLVNGDISSSASTTIQTGATLGGDGTLNNVINNGIISPGNSIGTLTAGQFTFNAGSEYVVEISGSQADLILATDTITINPGARINPFFSLPSLNLYRIAHADNGIVGSFPSFTLQQGRLVYNLLSDADDIFITVNAIPFIDILPEGNLQKIGACFDHMESLNLVSRSLFNVLNSLNFSSVSSAFEQFDPAMFNSTTISEQNIASNIIQLLNFHLWNLEDHSCSSGFMYWASPFYANTHQASSGATSALDGYKDKSSGILTGVDYRICNGLIVSSALSYATTQLSWHHNNQNGWINSYGGLLSLSWKTDRILVDADFSYLYHDSITKGFIEITSDLPFINPPLTYTKQTKGLSHANSYSFASGAVWDAYVYQNQKYQFSLWPYLDLEYTILRQAQYKQRNGPDLSMIIFSKPFDMWLSDLGLGCSFSTKTEKINFATDLSIGYLQETRINGKTTRGRFTALEDCSFNVNGLFPENHLISPKATIQITSNIISLSALLNFYGAYGKHFQQNQFSFEIKTTF